MKIGLVLECTLQGADLQVYSLFASRILGGQPQIEPSCATNKKILISEAGKRARGLFDEGCERVLIIWDLWPAWAERGARPSRNSDMKAVAKSLREAKVRHPCVYLICVDRMLETMLIVDGGAVSDVIGIPLGRKRPSHQNSPRHIADPKNYLTRWFRDHNKGQYTDYTHAKRIAEQMDTTRLRDACPEYGRFAQSLTQKPCSPPPAWRP
jgi:hypothetical protein